MHMKTKSPLPVGKGGGGMGERNKAKGGASIGGDLPGKPPAGLLHGGVCKCRRRFSAGVPGAKPPAK